MYDVGRVCVTLNPSDVMLRLYRGHCIWKYTHTIVGVLPGSATLLTTELLLRRCRQEKREAELIGLENIVMGL